MDKRRVPDARITVLLVSLLLIGLGWYGMRYYGRYQPFADLIGSNARNDLGNIGLAVNNAVLVGRTHGRTLWRIAARSVTLSRDQKQVVIEDIHDGRLYDNHERPVVALSAARATYATDVGFSGTEGVLTLEGGIHAVVLRPGGPSLVTDRLLWNAERRVVRIPGIATATFPGGAATAIGEDVAVDTRTGDLSLHHLHGTFRLPPGVQ